MIFLISFLVAATAIRAQDIIFEYDDADVCHLSNGANGICKDHRLCPEVYQNIPFESPKHCGFNGIHPIVCCPVKIDRVTEGPKILVPLIDISPPSVDFECGNSTPSEVNIVFDNEPNYAAAPPGEDIFNLPLSVDIRSQFNPSLPPGQGIPAGIDPFPGLNDPNSPFVYNETQVYAAVGGISALHVDAQYTFGYYPNAVGGISARRVVAKYTVLVGGRDAFGLEEWFCTGVLINRQWVLTAAHCLQREITLVRLGEHDYADPNDGSRPEDIDVIQVVLHPEFSHSLGYHDLALLRLSSTLRFEQSYEAAINPVCLPWGDAQQRDLTNSKITLTGWGATEFRGLGSSELQEVNVTIFDISVCQSSYSTLRNYQQVWPQGLREDALCAGDPEGGKDACQGDSGGPVTYLNSAKKYVLAGVVSRGYECGLKDFPGLYANMNHPPYLAWIKKVAFQ